MRTLVIVGALAATDAYCATDIPIFEESRLLPKAESGDADSVVRITVESTYVRRSDSPCLFIWNHARLVFFVLQGRVRCTFWQAGGTSAGVGIGAELGVSPQLSLAKGGETGALGEFLFNREVQAWPRAVIFGSARYKLLPGKLSEFPDELSFPGYNPSLIQAWTHVLDTNFSLGLMIGEDAQQLQGTAHVFFYQESLPLALRRVGALSTKASLQFKRVAWETRWKSDPWILGGGLSYVILTLNNIRVLFPLPILTLGVEW